MIPAIRHAIRLSACALLLALAGCGGGSGLASLGGAGPALPAGPLVRSLDNSGTPLLANNDPGRTDGTPLLQDDDGSSDPLVANDGTDGGPEPEIVRPPPRRAIEYVDAFYTSHGVADAGLNVKVEVYWGYWARIGRGSGKQVVGVMLLKDDARNWDNSERARLWSGYVYPTREPTGSRPPQAGRRSRLVRQDPRPQARHRYPAEAVHRQRRHLGEPGSQHAGHRFATASSWARACRISTPPSTMPASRSMRTGASATSNMTPAPAGLFRRPWAASARPPERPAPSIRTTGSSPASSRTRSPATTASAPSSPCGTSDARAGRSAPRYALRATRDEGV